MNSINYPLALLILILSSPRAGSAQSHFEVSTGGGTMTYFGELSTGNLKPSFQVHAHLYLSEVLFFRVQLLQGWVKDSDRNSIREAKRWRNLNFRSPVSEYALGAGFILNRTGKTRVFAYTGVGVFAFNPQGQQPNGRWTNLHPLGTEGQYLPGCTICPEPYKRWSFMFPQGIGVQYWFSTRYAAYAEIGHRVTVTDYLDDVGGYYANNESIDRNIPGAGYFADPHDKVADPTNPEGTLRGNPLNKDSYSYLHVGISIHLQ